MNYGLELEDTAEDDLARLDKTVAQQVIDKLRWLADNAEATRHKSLTYRLRGIFSLRVGSYRALYTISRRERRITVLFVRHRSQVYDIR